MTEALETNARSVAGMTKAVRWSDFETDMKLAMLLVADGMMNMLGHSPRAVHAAETFLGIKFPEGFNGGFIIYEASEMWGRADPEAFMASLKIDDTHLHRCVARSYRLLTELRPLSGVEVQDERDEAVDWVRYFLSSIPTDSYGAGDDYSGLVFDRSRPLPRLCNLADAYLSLVEFVQRAVGSGTGWGESSDMIVFTADDLALLADVDVRSVRNAMGPSGAKPIRSFRALPGDTDEDRAYADPVDAIEWLSGRRGFVCGRLDAAWIDRDVGATGSLKALCALAGMMFWLNGSTTEKMAETLGWDHARTRDWTRGVGVDAASAFEVATAAGLDAHAFSNRIHQLLSKED